MEKYNTIEEAIAAVQRLSPVPRTAAEYKKPCTGGGDPLLPNDPRRCYGNETWDHIGGWKGFLGQPIPEEKYKTIEEAMEAVQRLDPVPTSVKEYQKPHHQDASLMSNPD